MAIQVELAPETEARLAQEAQARGVDPGQYAGKLLQEALVALPAGSGRPTKEQFHKMLAALAKGAENLPDLPTSVFTRESFYEDRT